MFKKTLLGAIVAAGSLIGLAPAAHAQYNAVVSVAPPAQVYEVTPRARPGYVWAQGHHEWRHNHYVWVPGHWLRERAGYAYRNPHWVQRNNGEWAMIGGDWERRAHGDRDPRDVANRNFYRDRDGDGVPNRFDRRPDNPNRS